MVEHLNVKSGDPICNGFWDTVHSVLLWVQHPYFTPKLDYFTTIYITPGGEESPAMS